MPKKAEKCEVCGKKSVAMISIASGPDSYVQAHPCKDHEGAEPSLLLALVQREG